VAAIQCELFSGGGAKLADLRVASDRRGRCFELAQAGFDAQARPFIGLEVDGLAAQQIGTLADFGVLQGAITAWRINARVS